MKANKAYHFLRYVNKVFGLEKAFKSFRDGRQKHHIPLESVLKCFLLGLVCRKGSLNQIEESIRLGVFDKALGKGPKPSADTVGYALKRTEPGAFKNYNSYIIQKARYNKVFSGGTVDGLLVAAIDGTELYSTKSESRSCRHCSVRTVNEVKEYYERVVAVSYVGSGPPLILGIRRQRKGEGELPAAIGLLKELNWRNTRFCDAIVGDALYAASPFINEATSQNKWVAFRVKRENYHVVRDAEGLFAGRKPDFEERGITDFKGSIYDIRIWDEENFTSWDKVKEPLRCLKVEETRYYSKNGEQVSETIPTYIVTTCPKALVKPKTVWKIMHKRWGIENSVFHEAKTCCSLDHSFVHHEIATEVAWLLQIIALNLLLMFKWRALRGKKQKWTLRGLSEAIFVGLVSWPQRVYIEPFG